VRVRYGYPRLHVLLRREGWSVNAKRIYRLYKEEGLVIRVKSRPARRGSGRSDGLHVGPALRRPSVTPRLRSSPRTSMLSLTTSSPPRVST
jgi:transposase InsO family protein